MIDWLKSTSFYWIFCITLLVLGAAAVCMAFIGDRWRYGTKTPRCQRCRYDMSGVRADDTLRKCPECGHEHKNERLLHRPRLGRKRLIVGVMMACTSLYLLLSPDVRRGMQTFDEPWHIAAIPDTARIALWRWLGDDIRKVSIKRWAPNVISPNSPISRLNDWQIDWLLSQLASDVVSSAAQRRRRGYSAAGLIELYYEGFEGKTGQILRQGLHDSDDDARNNVVYWCMSESVNLSQSDLRQILNIAVTDKNHDTQRFAIAALNTHAKQMPPSLREEVWLSLTKLMSDPQVTYEVVLCFLTIDAQRALTMLPRLLRDKNIDVSRLTLAAASDAPAVWSIIADYYRECPVEREDYLLNELERRDSKRREALFAELQSSTDPLLRAKAERAIKYLKELEDWTKSGEPGTHPPRITTPQGQPYP